MPELIIELKEIHPYEGHEEWVLHYAEDQYGQRYYIVQVETGIKYSEVIDLYPCKYTYQTTQNKIEPEPEPVEPEEQPEEEQA